MDVQSGESEEEVTCGYTSIPEDGRTCYYF